MELQYLSLSEIPTFSRFWDFLEITKSISLTRALQYEMLEKQSLSGFVLDVGGGENARYRNLISCEEYHSINIDKSIFPTWEVKVGEQFPCPPNNYDFVISFNTFEHIYDVRFVLSEIYKALTKGGQLIATMPFLYPIHAHPDDFARLTPSWFNIALTEINFKEIEITPLSWGPFSSGLAASGVPGPARKFRKNNALLIDLIYAKLQISRGNKLKLSDILYRHALAFFIKAKK